MYKILNLLVFFFIVIQQIRSQVFPKDGSSLNYRLIGFSLPEAEDKINSYSLEIATGSYYSDDSFKKNIIITLHSSNNRMIAEVPSFGNNYTWRSVYTGKNKSITKSNLFHFSTQTCSNVDTSFFRFRVLKNNDKYKDAYIFLDDNKTLYDMHGHPVWFMPDIAGIHITPRDLKLSPAGTITFLFDPPYEINYNGDVLWKAPNAGRVSGDYSEHYHHEFTRLSNSHYMVLGMDSILWKHPIQSTINNLATNAGMKTNEVSNDTTFRKMTFGTLIEYDEKGKVVWSWKSSLYFDSSDLCYFIPPVDKMNIDVHENAFFFDEKNKAVYVSFKNISRVVKIKYPEGTVTNAYGEIYKPGVPEMGNGLFCGQHACKHSDDGYLYLYNNNVCDSTSLPKIVILKEPESGTDSLEKIWEYECTIDGVTGKEKKRYRFISGGNVEQLSDRSLFVCMSGIYSKIFIVNMDKEETWSALPERWNVTEKNWDVVGQYRASIIQDRKELEQLIWNSEK